MDCPSCTTVGAKGQSTALRLGQSLTQRRIIHKLQNAAKIFEWNKIPTYLTYNHIGDIIAPLQKGKPMTNDHPEPLHSSLLADSEANLPAAAYLRYEARADGWSAGRQAAFLAHLADNGVVEDAARCVGKALSGGYALRRQARGYGFNLGWEAALLIARRVVADAVMAAAIKGETARWVREEGVTTYTRTRSSR
jgi:hypothetical protein